MDCLNVEPRYFLREDSIKPSHLINHELLERSKELSISSNTLTFWFNKNAGKQLVNGGVFGEQLIDAANWPKGFVKQIKRALKEVDLITGLSIEFSKTKKDADIHIYRDKDIELTPGTEHLGVTTYNKGIGPQILSDLENTRNSSEFGITETDIHAQLIT